MTFPISPKQSFKDSDFSISPPEPKKRKLTPPMENQSCEEIPLEKQPIQEINETLSQIACQSSPSQSSASSSLAGRVNSLQDFKAEKFISLRHGFYKGEMKNGEPDGFGVLKFSDHVYTGEFSKGLFHGQGEIIFCDGSKYKGPFVHDVRSSYLRNGEKVLGKNGELVQGTLTYKDGRVYTGSFKDNSPDGSGKMEGVKLNIRKATSDPKNRFSNDYRLGAYEGLFIKGFYKKGIFTCYETKEQYEVEYMIENNTTPVKITYLGKKTD